MRKGSIKQGFTILELSIVLVVIGLMVAGVLVGQHLISSAEIRRQVGQFAEIQGAAETFKAKYRFAPGDFPKASTMLPGTGTADGDGNGQLTQTTLAAQGWTGELRQFWIHLANSEFISLRLGGASGSGEIGIDFPRAVAVPAGIVAVYAGPSAGGDYVLPTQGELTYGHYLWPNIGVNFDGTYNVIGQLSTSTGGASGRKWPSRIVQQIDQKIDDGNALTGTVIVPSVFYGSDAFGGSNGPGWTRNDACRDADGLYINLDADAPVVGEGDSAACYFAVRMSF